MTKTQVVKLIKAKYPGRAYELRHDPKALIGADRVKERERRDALREQEKELKDKLSAFNRVTAFKALADTARFVVDVNGDSPSIEQLAMALELVEKIEALNDDIRDVRAEWEKARNKGFRDRYEVVVWKHGDGLFCTSVARGESLEEIAEKLQASEYAII